MHPALRHLVFAVPLLLAGGRALADEPSPGYIGIGVGESRYDYDAKRCTEDFGISCRVTSVDNSFRILAGLHLAPAVAFEVGYADFGKLKGSALGLPVSAGIEEAVTAVDVALIATANINDTFSVSGKIGAFSADSKLTASISGIGSTSDSATNSNVLIGVAATASFTPHLSARLDAERYSKAAEGDIDIDLASVSLIFAF